MPFQLPCAMNENLSFGEKSFFLSLVVGETPVAAVVCSLPLRSCYCSCCRGCPFISLRWFASLYRCKVRTIFIVHIIATAAAAFQRCRVFCSHFFSRSFISMLDLFVHPRCLEIIHSGRIQCQVHNNCTTINRRRERVGKKHMKQVCDEEQAGE